MLSWIKNTSRSLPRPARAHRARPQLESLEGRLVLAGSISLSNHVLNIVGTNLSDTAEVKLVTTPPSSSGLTTPPQVVVTLSHPKAMGTETHTKTYVYNLGLTPNVTSIKV